MSQTLLDNIFYVVILAAVFTLEHFGIVTVDQGNQIISAIAIGVGASKVITARSSTPTPTPIDSATTTPPLTANPTVGNVPPSNG